MVLVLYILPETGDRTCAWVLEVEVQPSILKLSNDSLEGRILNHDLIKYGLLTIELFAPEKFDEGLLD